jgi:putative ABC transport system substrate-binding protein
MDALQQGLREYGHVEDQTIHVVYRAGDGGQDRLAHLAAELVNLPSDVILASGNLSISAAMDATKLIPIVMLQSVDPVGNGLVASLGRPGGNVTGLSNFGPRLQEKRLELLKEALPRASRVAVMTSPSAQTVGSPSRDDLEASAAALALELLFIEVQSVNDVADAFGVMGRAAADGVLVSQGQALIVNRALLANLAVEHRLPSISFSREYAAVGGLMAYGPSIAAQFRRAAYYVDRILNGTKPADLPIEQPMILDFVVNMKTAQALGITFPNEIMLQVTEVIQ